MRTALRSLLIAAGALAAVATVVAAGVAPGSPFALGATKNGGATLSAPTVTGQTHRQGYLTVSDGTQLAYDLVLPGDGSGKYPTLFEYSGYSPGSQVDSGYVPLFVPKGYAMIGVNIRGTGCSGGTFDFFAPQQSQDGYDAVEWIASQPWSDTHVGMIGKSFPGIAQLFVAEQKPPHLDAAAPGHVYGDIYRDVAYPGGIFNYAFAGLWAFVAQPAPGYQMGLQQSANGDPVCAQNIAQHTVANVQYNAFLQAQEHMFDDALMKERSPLYAAANISVPVYMFQSWQDEQVGPRGLDVVEKLTAPYFLTVSNGDHGMYRTPDSLARLGRFFDHYVKGIANGFENEPRVTVWWDSGSLGTRAPAWTRTYSAWPVTAVAPLTLHLRAGGILADSAPTGDEPADAYVYPGGSTSNEAGYGYSNPQTWSITDKLRAPAPLRATYTTSAFANDIVMLGNGNLTFWLSSTAPDTDVQVTLSEVRPDGKVVFVQHGWLRASHRDLDGARSSQYRPFQSHTALDLLTPGTPTQMSIEIFPFGHAFRAGSKLQITLEAPTVLPELWGFAPLPLPAVNSIYHDAGHDATLVLPVLPGEHADTPLPPCGSLIRQGCV